MVCEIASICLLLDELIIGSYNYQKYAIQYA